IRAPGAAQPVRSRSRADRPAHRVGLLPRPERLHVRHAPQARSAGRALRSRLPRLHPGSPRLLARGSASDGRQPDRRRHQRRSDGPSPVRVPAHPESLRDVRAQHLSLLGLHTTRRRRPRHVRLPCRQSGALSPQPRTPPRLSETPNTDRSCRMSASIKILMKAALLRVPALIEKNPLVLADVPTPHPAENEVLVRVRYCGVCRTDLHVIEGELKPRKSPLTPGHQVVGVIEDIGIDVKKFQPGARVGVAWLHSTDGTCQYCRSGAENLCDNPTFTGYTVDGGYAEYIVAPEDFVYTIPDGFSDQQAAPLLCAGIIGFRSLRMTGIQSGGKLGFYGFGAAAHVAIQVARHWNVDVYAATRDVRHQTLARELGAVWTGDTFDAPPEQLDAAIVFAPAGAIVPAALNALRKGGTLVLGGIHMSQIPTLDYQ